MSELRRDVRGLIFRIERGHQPLFITQRGYVTAVLLSREEYDAMCVLRDKGLKAIHSRLPLGDQMPRVREVEDRPDYWNEW